MAYKTVAVGLAMLLLLAGCSGKQAKQEPAQGTPSMNQSSQPTNQTPSTTQADTSRSRPEGASPANPAAEPATAPGQPTPTTDAQTKTTPSGLKYVDLQVGTGPSPTQGQKVTVHYTGWLTNGKKFDSSLDRGQPFSFMIGTGQVIPGWDEGVMTMKVGGKRKLIIPPKLAYADRDVGNGLIPANSTLIFEVQLLGVQ